MNKIEIKWFILYTKFPVVKYHLKGTNILCKILHIGIFNRFILICVLVMNIQKIAKWFNKKARLIVYIRWRTSLKKSEIENKVM